MTYEYICTKCGRKYFSAAPIESHKNNKCEIQGCNGEVVYTEKQKKLIETQEKSKLEGLVK